MNYPSNLKYTKDHEWISIEGNTATIGITDFAANLMLGVATTKGLVSVAMVFGSLYPIATALLAYKFLHERLHKVQYVGIAFAVVGVAIISAF